MKKRVFRKRYEVKEKPKKEVVVVEEPKVEEKPAKPRKERIWKQ